MTLTCSFFTRNNVHPYLPLLYIANCQNCTLLVTDYTFSYKDYKQGAASKEMTLDAMEFIRRFAMHILPKGLVRIRHYGILSSTSKTAYAAAIKEQLPAAPEIKNVKLNKDVYNPLQCPCCKKETMQTLVRYPNQEGHLWTGR